MDERRFARTGNARYGDENTKRDRYRDVLQIMLAGTDDLDLLFGDGTTFLRNFDFGVASQIFRREGFFALQESGKIALSTATKAGAG